MNIEKLIAAAKRIDAIAEAQGAHTKHLQNLAKLVRTVAQDSIEHRQLIQESKVRPPIVFDMGDAVRDLRKALKAKASPNPEVK